MLELSRITIILIGIIVLVTTLNRLQRWRRNRAFSAAHGCQPPARLSRFRNLIQQIKAIKSHTWLDMWCRRYSTVAATFESATVSIDPIIFTNEPENIKAMLSTDFESFDLGDRRRRLVGPLLGPGIFSNDGPAWRHSRVSGEALTETGKRPGSVKADGLQAMLRPHFTKMQISDLSTFESHLQHLLTALPPVDQYSGLVEVDLQPLFFRMTLDSASEVLLGPDMSFNSQSDPPGSTSQRFLEAFDYAQIKITGVRSVLDRGWTKPFGLMYKLLKGSKKDNTEEAYDTVHSIMDDMIAEFLRAYHQKPFTEGAEKVERNGKYTFLDEMAKSTTDPRELRDEIINVLTAGRDTTASLLSNAFFLLARHPITWNRVRAEVEETFADKLPDYTTLRSMKQVKNLLNECKCSQSSWLSTSRKLTPSVGLRLFPPVPFNSRTATANTTLPRGGGRDENAPIFIKGGQQVNYHVYSLHRLTETFGPDADEFRPDRWDDASLRPGWGFIP